MTTEALWAFVQMTPAPHRPRRAYPLTLLSCGDQQRLLTTGQLAHLIGVSAETIRLEIQQGEVSAIRVGRRPEYRIPVAEARRYLTRIGVLEPDPRQS